MESNITGTKSPRIEKQKAPINPMNGPIVGTATANNTTAVTRTVLEKKCVRRPFSERSSKWLYIPHNIVDKKWSLLEFIFDRIPRNFNAYKELKTKRTENSQCNEYLNSLCWSEIDSE